jgi:hypothetical protein
MAIRIKGANPRSYTTEKILEAACRKRLKDSVLGIPLQIITLYWNPLKKNYHQTKTKGDFDDVFITRMSAGGLELEYRNPGSLEWLKDGLTGEFTAAIAVTPRNINLLASHYYDKLWTIGDPVIEEKVKAMADEIDEENKNKPHSFTKIVRKLDPETKIYVNVEQVIHSNMYEYHKQRRDTQFKSHSETASYMQPMAMQPERLNIESDKILTREKNLSEREKAIAQREIDLGIVNPNGAVISTETKLNEEPTGIGFTEGELSEMHFTKLRTLAFESFGIKDAKKLTKKQILAKIDVIQKNSSNTKEEDLITSSEENETDIDSDVTVGVEDLVVS